MARRSILSQLFRQSAGYVIAFFQFNFFIQCLCLANLGFRYTCLPLVSGILNFALLQFFMHSKQLFTFEREVKIAHNQIFKVISCSDSDLSCWKKFIAYRQGRWQLAPTSFRIYFFDFLPAVSLSSEQHIELLFIYQSS